MARSKTDIPRARVEIYDRHIRAHPEIERKGAANPYTSLNGHMFSGINKAREIGIRLSKEDQAAFLEEIEGAKPFISFGATMRGYVTVPDHILEDDEQFRHWLDRSHAYVKSLEPKPTKKKKKG